MTRRLCALGLALVSLVGSTGCGRHYWSKPGAGADVFAQESAECARDNALYRSASREFGIVLEERYKAGLTDRGWVRAQQRDPPPGWYRGIEGDEPVRFNGQLF
jgi:hypothetical protein